MGYRHILQLIIFNRQVVSFDPKNCGKTHNTALTALFILDFRMRILDFEMNEVGTSSLTYRKRHESELWICRTEPKTTIHGLRRTIQAGKRHVKNEAG